DGLLEGAGLALERARALAASPTIFPTAAEAIAISRSLGIPLHPFHTPRFDRVSPSDLAGLRKSAKMEGHIVVVDAEVPHTRWILNTCLIEHTMEEGTAVVRGEAALILRALLRLDEPDLTVPVEEPDYVRRLSGIQLGRQSTTTIGVRVGRPEKAMMRRMKPPVHALFPVGYEGGSMRDVFSAAKVGRVEIEVINLYCRKCGERRLDARCQVCGEETEPYMACPRCSAATQDIACPNCKTKTLPYSKFDFDFRSKLESVRAKIPHLSTKPVKCVRGLTSVSKVPEALEKGMIRSRHGVFVYKDGTMRIDATNEPLTHFRPTDVKGDLETLVRLGYERDTDGMPLQRDDQVVELKPQDIIVPADIGNDLVKMAQCIDDELQSLYGLDPFYRVTKPDDLLGKLVIGLAPHTSVGVAGRIVGFSATEVCLANPYWHSAKRRDCDGDGDSLILLLDALLNFSLQYVPAQIGGYMDTPLLIQPVILPAEVDEQAHNFDIASSYPLEFYEKTTESPPAASVATMIESIGSRLESDTQFYGYGFTHPTSSITVKRPRASYSTLRTLNEKISKQIEVASLVEAVSTRDVVESIIKTHLIRDIMGNAKKYATQAFKCRSCGLTLRRPPLTAKCPSCGGEIKGTLTRASVEKYLYIAQKLARDYDVDPYLRSRLDMLQRELDQLFQGPRKADQLELTDFLKPILTE
ncbi:MAG: DNA polymerase II large subunit, partial [Nitrososphaerota archaeon]|nr:DNA polymerase II large subunit [Nitrososphaerota archaeon]